MIQIDYPRPNIRWDDVCNQTMFEQMTASLFAWQQGLGQFGGLHLHPCWQEGSVLARGYQGQGLHLNGSIMAGCKELFERTGELRWSQMVHDIARNILLLQQPGGGFRHSSSEFEPAYGSEESCPIQQGFAMLDLLDYAEWKYADVHVIEQIKFAYERFWTWFYNFFWRLGNLWLRPLPFDAFCGVTNQDLVVLAVLAKAQKIFGCSLFDMYGKTVLETYLSPRYYHTQIGLFERGDKSNFVERTGYYGIILPMIKRLFLHTGDERLIKIHENVSLKLFDSIFIADDGLAHFSWGAQTFDENKSQIAGWDRYPLTIATYPELLFALEDFLHHSEDHQLLEQLDSVRDTLAAYLFSDGSMPTSLGGGNELFQIVSTRQDTLWHYMIHKLGDHIQSPQLVEQVCVHRRCGTTTWKTCGRLWAIEQDGQRIYTGCRSDPGGIEHGHQYLFRGLDMSILNKEDIDECVNF